MPNNNGDGMEPAAHEFTQYPRTHDTHMCSHFLRIRPKKIQIHYTSAHAVEAAALT